METMKARRLLKMVKRFFYNSENGKLQLFDNGHVEFFHNRKAEFSENFDFYIRGIITEENKILLRVFYPYENISELSYNELLEKSRLLLSNELPAIEKALKAQGVKPESFVLNVTNESAKDILKTCFV
jgi:hypothetical protein